MSEIVRNRVRVKTATEPWTNEVAVLVRTSNAVATNITFTAVEPGNHIDPTFRLDAEAAQELMDSLYANGFRPSEAAGSAGALAATQRHLDDMRRLVFEGKP